MPELTISMPAFNAGKYIRQSIDSVLHNNDVDCEIIVVDDSSDDNTVEIVESINDPRIRLIRNKQTRGIPYCHNLVIENSTSPFITHVDSDDFVLPGALKKIIRRLKSKPRIGQVGCCGFLADEKGRTTRKAFVESRKRALKRGSEKVDKGKMFLHDCNRINLRTYRREVFNKVGKFDERLEYNYEYDMALRVIEYYDIYILPEILCGFGVQKSNAVDSLKCKNLSFFFQRIFICRELARTNKISFVQPKYSNLIKLLFLSSCHYLKIPKVNGYIANIPSNASQYIKSNTNDLSMKCYSFVLRYFSWWPIRLFEFKGNKRPYEEKRIAYFLWRFPILSETFIQREIAALRTSGLDVEVFADAHEGTELLDNNAKSLIRNTHYLLPMDEKLLSKYKKYFFLKNPLLYLSLLLYVITHKYRKYKELERDISIFSNAVYLAGLLKENGANHIHSPWTNIGAFISLIASRLLGVPYTVQSRAYDIHYKDGLEILVPILRNAKFIITNSNYNEKYLRSILNSSESYNIHTIYNGINLQRFKPKNEKRNPSKETKILTVARLVEQKGIDYLLKALSKVKERGFLFRSEIIGAPINKNYYIKLKMLQRKLGLEDRVFFSGAQSFNKVMKEYKIVDFVVLPSLISDDGRRDITPNTLIEAMAMKLPVISTNITAIPEIVDNGVNGILIPSQDENALAEAMIKLICDIELRKRMGENARRKVSERFNMNKNIAQYIELFSGSMGKNSKQLF